MVFSSCISCYKPYLILDKTNSFLRGHMHLRRFHGLQFASLILKIGVDLVPGLWRHNLVARGQGRVPCLPRFVAASATCMAFSKVSARQDLKATAAHADGNRSIIITAATSAKSDAVINKGKRRRLIGGGPSSLRQ